MSHDLDVNLISIRITTPKFSLPPIKRFKFIQSKAAIEMTTSRIHCVKYLLDQCSRRSLNGRTLIYTKTRPKFLTSSASLKRTVAWKDVSTEMRWEEIFQHTWKESFSGTNALVEVVFSSVKQIWQTECSSIEESTLE